MFQAGWEPELFLVSPVLANKGQILEIRPQLLVNNKKSFRIIYCLGRIQSPITSFLLFLNLNGIDNTWQ